MTAKGFRRSVPPAKGAREFAGKPWTANRDAVNLLLAALSYPTIPPEPPISGKRRVHRILEDLDDDEENDNG